MHILVTGGGGFIGSHLCDRLIGDGHSVYCLDNFSTGSRQNIRHLEARHDFTVIEHDITDSVDLSQRFDQVYNLACPASPKAYQATPIETMMTSVLGARNALEIARRDAATILQASTSEVYGDPLQHPQTEDYYGNVNPNGIRACYDEGKRAAEALFFDYHRVHGVNIKVARIFNTFGPRMQRDDGRVVTNFLDQALSGDKLTIYGDGSQTRSFCYVTDMVEGLVSLMNTPAEVTGPVNLGGTDEITIRDIAQEIIDLTNSDSELEFRDLPGDDPKVRRPDTTRASRLLNWKPRVAYREGLATTLTYFMDNYHGGRRA